MKVEYNMTKILLEEKYVLEYIRDMLNTLKVSPKEVINARYHHNTNYENIVSILKNGILSLLEANKLGVANYSFEFLNLMNDITSHANGIDSVSLSVVGLTDLYPKETEYNSDSPNYVDLVISNDIETRRSSINYGNEFLVYNKIGVDKIKSIDIRLLNLMKGNNFYINDQIKKYNCLKDIALVVRELKLNILLREISNDNLTLDIDKVSKTPQIILK